MFLTSYWLLSQLCEFLYFCEVQWKGKWLGPMLRPNSSPVVLNPLMTVRTAPGHIDWGSRVKGNVCLRWDYLPDLIFQFPKANYFRPKQCPRLTDVPATRNKAGGLSRV